MARVREGGLGGLGVCALTKSKLSSPASASIPSHPPSLPSPTMSALHESLPASPAPQAAPFAKLGQMSISVTPDKADTEIR